MKKTGWTILLATALSYIPVVGAQEQTSEEPFKPADWKQDFTIAIGTKLWFNEWTTWGFDISDFGRLGVSSASQLDNHEFTPIPIISVKYQDFFVSASYFVDTQYNFSPLTLGHDQIERNEWDVTVGYYVLPPYLALTVGFKEIHQEKFRSAFPEVGGTEYQIDGPTVGFAGAVPMKWGFSLYSSFAYGFMETEQEEVFGDGLFGLTPGDDDRDTAYWLVEAGVAYTHDLRNLPVISSATFYAGYRHQQVEIDDVVAINNPLFDPSFNNTDDDALDITRGMVIGVNLSF